MCLFLPVCQVRGYPLLFWLKIFAVFPVRAAILRRRLGDVVPLVFANFLVCFPRVPVPVIVLFVASTVCRPMLDVFLGARRFWRVNNVNGNGIDEGSCHHFPQLAFLDDGRGGSIYAAEAVGYDDQDVFRCLSAFGVNQVREARYVNYGNGDAVVTKINGLSHEDLEGVISGVRELVVSAR